MINKNAVKARLSLAMVLVFMVYLVLPVVPATPIAVAEESNGDNNGTQALGDLKIGDMVTDITWEWKYREGINYSGSGEIKPVTWIVVAKEHYGLGSGVTLLSEESIAMHQFDNSTNISERGSNHWGYSGTHSTATRGIRSWLNSTGIHKDEGFFNVFPQRFREALIKTSVPCKENTSTYNGNDYTVEDYVFLPSITELNSYIENTAHNDESVWEYYQDAGNIERKARFSGSEYNYWTRTPCLDNDNALNVVDTDGSLNCNNNADDGNKAVRPVVNISSETPVSRYKNVNGVHEIIWPERILGDVELGTKIVDYSWEWEHRIGDNYTESGETKPVTWIVVAKDHYGNDSGVTLLSEELIGRYTFDNSTDIDDWGSNHWGDSGRYATSTKGIRPWLNSNGIHIGEGFYNSFSERFKSYINKVNIPNKEWENGDVYYTQDNVLIPSNTELGQTDTFRSYEIGKVFPYFKDDTLSRDRRLALLNGVSMVYWSRSPVYYGPRYINYCGQDIHYVYTNQSLPIRPVINLSSETLISGMPNMDGVYLIGGDEQRDFLIGDPGSGDITGGGVNVSDAIEVLRYIVGLSNLATEQLAAADVNQDGKVDVSDAITILRYIVGLVDFLPIQFDKLNVLYYFGKTVGEIEELLGQKDRFYSVRGSDGSIYSVSYKQKEVDFIAHCSYGHHGLYDSPDNPDGNTDINDRVVGAAIYGNSKYHFRGINANSTLEDVINCFGIPDSDDYDIVDGGGYIMRYNSINDKYSISIFYEDKHVDSITSIFIVEIG